jgi:lipopolysaccharide/colanic/teichoic acid biosynthesis glycosyltransferase
LRKTSLDELPQLISVLKGDMSLVGPRPDVADALRIYRPQDYIRLTVKPGITGWAAIHGRNTVPLDQRRDLDIEYVTKYSLRLDIEILLRTIPYVLASRGVNTYSASGRNTDVQH